MDPSPTSYRRILKATGSIARATLGDAEGAGPDGDLARVWPPDLSDGDPRTKVKGRQ
jgi:hypothetical protein